jgi:F420-non-reducing hydrogenase iron-sulfur subunit
MKTPHNIRIVRVMCSGRVDPQFIIEAFAQGADGVIVSGCHPGDCHYMEGNYKALRRMLLLRKLLGQLGIEPERLRLEWISASEARKFVEITTDTAEKLRKLGPLKPRLDYVRKIMEEVVK